VFGGRVKPHTLVLGVAAVLVCARAAMPAGGGTTTALTAAASTQMLVGSVPVMVSISGPLDVRSAQPASLGTAVHLAADGEAINGATVVLEHKLEGSRAWTEAARAITDSRGRAVFVVPVASPRTDFRARSLEDPHYAGASSAVITVAAR
jgi:hypothetical protein